MRFRNDLQSLNPTRLRPWPLDLNLRNAAAQVRIAKSQFPRLGSGCTFGVPDAPLTGLEPVTSAVTGQRANQLRHRTLFFYCALSGFVLSWARIATFMAPENATYPHLKRFFSAPKVAHTDVIRIPIPATQVCRVIGMLGR